MSRRLQIGSVVLASVLVGAAAWALDGRQHSAPPAREAPDRDLDSRVQQGFRIAPTQLDLEGKNPALVGLGSYLVNASGGCNDCHSCPSYAKGVEHNPYFGGDGKVNTEGYLAGGVPFQLGPNFTLRSANLTPDADGKPAGLTWDEFHSAIRTGVDPHEAPRTLQVMPWPVFRNLTDRDLRAIYTYLSAIPSLETPPDGTCSFAGEGTLPPPPPAAAH